MVGNHKFFCSQSPSFQYENNIKIERLKDVPFNKIEYFKTILENRKVFKAVRHENEEQELLKCSNNLKYHQTQYTISGQK